MLKMPEEDSWAGVALGAATVLSMFVTLNLAFSMFGH